MPCDLAVSIAKATVTEERLLALLTPQSIEPVVRLYLERLYPGLSLGGRQGKTTVTFTVGPLPLSLDYLSISLTRGVVTVRSYLGNRETVETLAADLSRLLVQLAHRHFQEQVQQALGPLVKRTEILPVNNNGTQQKATVFTLSL